MPGKSQIKNHNNSRSLHKEAHKLQATASDVLWPQGRQQQVSSEEMERGPAFAIHPSME